MTRMRAIVPVICLVFLITGCETTSGGQKTAIGGLGGAAAGGLLAAAVGGAAPGLLLEPSWVVSLAALLVIAWMCRPAGSPTRCDAGL